MILHGLIHLMGFTKEWQLGPKSQLKGKTLFDLSGNAGRFAGLLWLITCLLLIGAALTYIMQREWYWILASVALIISQLLIIIYWQDAKFGTIANVMILIAIIFSAGHMQFNGMVRNEIKSIISNGSPGSLVVTEDMIKDLPLSVQRWLHQSNIIGKETSNVVHIKQKGQMRTKPGNAWMAFEAEQYFTIDPPAFLWNAKIKAAPYIDIVARDKYENGQGNMLIKALYIYRVANSSGKEIDQGTLLRYLAEIVWFPQAALSDYLDWEEIDDHHARVTMSYHDVTASGIYTFNDEGRVAQFEAQRYGSFDGVYKTETWSITSTGFKVFNGTPIANTSQVTWKLKGGDFTWLKLEVTDIVR